MSRIDGGFNISDDNGGQVVDDNTYEEHTASRRDISNGIINEVGGGKSYGFNLENVVEALVDGEMGDEIPSLERNITNTNVRISAVSSLENIMSQLKQTTLEPLEAGISPYTLTSSNPSEVVVSAENDNKLDEVKPFTVQVDKLAKANTWIFNSAKDNEKEAIKGSGSLEITLADGDKKTITIPAGSSLDSIAEKINHGDDGVQASVVKQADGYRLVVSSAKTGADNEISFNFTADPDSDEISTLFSDKTEKQVAQDAEYNIDGIDRVSSSNEIHYHQVVMTLNKEGATATVGTSSNSDSVNKAVNGFVNNFNELMDSIKHLTSSTPGKQYQGSLHKDSDMDTVVNSIKNTLLTVLPNDDALNSLGIMMNNDGTLTLNQSKLSEAINDNPKLANSVFSTLMSSSSDSLTLTDYNKTASVLGAETKSGTYDVNVTQVATAANLQATNSLTLNGSGEVDLSSDVKISMSVFGEENPGNFAGTSKSTDITVTVPAGQYTPEALAEKIQDEINSNSKIKASNADMKVSISDNHLVFASNHLGSLTGFNIKSDGSENTADIGIDAGDMDKSGGNIGGDAIGTINGQFCLSDGQYIKAQDDSEAGNDASGMTVKVSGTETGDIGTVSLNKGYADQLDSLFSGYTNFSKGTPEKSGLLAKKLYDYQQDLSKTSLDSLVSKLKEAKAKKENITERYFEQYRSVNSILTKMNDEQAYIKNMFSSHKDND